MSITAGMVKDLREKTQAGMMDCKKALEECLGDMEKAVDWLRQKGLAKAAKRADRATSEGLIICKSSEDAKNAVLVEVRCETDFVAKGDLFTNFANKVAHDFHLSKAPAVDFDSVAAEVNNIIATMGENITLGKTVRIQAAEYGLVSSYVHANGKIAVLVEIDSDKDVISNPLVKEMGKNIAMQIAASNPIALDSSELNPELIEREREVYRQKAKEEGKPENIIEKIADGAVKKYCKEVCLLDQAYIRDDKMSVQDLVASVSKEVGAKLSVKSFIRVQLGQE